jgi:hypothetical protein
MITCDQCGATFKGKQGLERHKKRKVPCSAPVKEAPLELTLEDAVLLVRTNARVYRKILAATENSSVPLEDVAKMSARVMVNLAGSGALNLAGSEEEKTAAMRTIILRCREIIADHVAEGGQINVPDIVPPRIDA